MRVQFCLNVDVGDYPSAAQYQTYLESYATHFNLRQHIHFRHRIISVSAGQDERWVLEVQNGNDKKIKVLADKVFIATGPLTKAHRPKYEGEDIFNGQIIHSQAYKE